MKRINKIIKALLLVALIVAIISVIYLVVIHNPGEDYTEFYLLDSNNDTTDYPTNVTQYSIEKIIIGIINKEHKQVNYTVKVKKDGYLQAEYNYTLDNNEKIETPYYLNNANVLGNDQLLVVELYKDDIDAPYRTLNLRYNVVK
ncbi:MAG: DUF1616 domain-containing protein [Methanosphaera sp.]|uniref:DUF1616 domain-containing protein n=1 Tax=Methanosphaera sp. BMS TaxID=1789762 RepID=UPI000DC1F454|nr:DUF1616 domain-containing protein [Methanosphaera sp. BMS]AWX32840.1 hypothetical protein AW729_06890 [Methanosphaera sp. BMS]MBQ6444688.1 DUF1616 domain-containing protein [Methanosphaera sp.]MBR3213455.1 DUF1616 domain-containing protein [Methanosphaera sp.]